MGRRVGVVGCGEAVLANGYAMRIMQEGRWQRKV